MTLKPESLALRIGSTDLMNEYSSFPRFINAVVEWFCFSSRMARKKEVDKWESSLKAQTAERAGLGFI